MGGSKAYQAAAARSALLQYRNSNCASGQSNAGIATAGVRYDVDSFDNIQLCVPDIHSVPRGKVVSGEIRHRLLEDQFNMYRGCTMLTPTGQIPCSLRKFFACFPKYTLRPCVETLVPWPWINTGRRRAGNVLCNMYRPDGTPDLNCPRQQLRHQLDALQDEHGLVVRTALEYEFFVFHENTLRPLGGGRNNFDNLRVWGEHQDLFGDLQDVLKEMGVTITSVVSELAAGQFELNTEPVQGIAGADVGFYVKNAVKGFLKTRGYHATFMTRPTLDTDSSGLHLNHSLWKADSTRGASTGRHHHHDNNVNNVLVGADPAVEPLSPTAKHWIAGLLAHGPALCAFLSPTVNCYRRLHGRFVPIRSVWGMEERLAEIYVRAEPGNNVFLENRLPSAAASPYLALAVTVAAGRDGLKRRLQCPDPVDAANASELPHSLDQALTALEEDGQLAQLMGRDFVSCYVRAKRDGEVAPYESRAFHADDQRIAFERDMYFTTY